MLNSNEGSALAFLKRQPRKLFDMRIEDILIGLRDRAILSAGLQVGLRRAEIGTLENGAQLEELQNAAGRA